MRRRVASPCDAPYIGLPKESAMSDDTMTRTDEDWKRLITPEA